MAAAGRLPPPRSAAAPPTRGQYRGFCMRGLTQAAHCGAVHGPTSIHPQPDRTQRPEGAYKEEVLNRP